MMNKIVVIFLLLLLLCCIGYTTDELDHRQRMETIRATEIPTTPGIGLDELCFLFNYNPGSPMLFNPGWFWDSEKVVTYYNPADCWTYNPPSPYPFQIDSIWIPFYFSAAIPSGWYTFGVELSCPDTTDPLCPYPNPDPAFPVCMDTFQVYHPGGISLAYMIVPFECCVDDPFFLALEFLDSPVPNLYPGLCFDSDDISSCVQYYNYPYPWVEWRDTFMYNNNLCDLVTVVYGNSNSSCPPNLCPGELIPVEPNFIDGTTYIDTFNTCLYDSVFDLEPCTAWPDHAQDMAFYVNFVNGGDNNLSVTVSPTYPWAWDISLAILSDSGDFNPPSCICGEDEHGVGIPESCVLEGLPDGLYYIHVSGFYSYCGEYEIDVNMSLSQNYFPGPPRPVDDLNIQRFYDNVALSWSSVTEDTLGFPLEVSYYVVYMSTEDAFFEPASADSVATVYPPSTRYIDSNALNDRQRFYRVKSFVVD
jgi:hypothetical protein